MFRLALLISFGLLALAPQSEALGITLGRCQDACKNGVGSVKVVV